MATVLMPSFLHVRMMRMAISPRLAIRILSNSCTHHHTTPNLACRNEREKMHDSPSVAGPGCPDDAPAKTGTGRSSGPPTRRPDTAGRQGAGLHDESSSACSALAPPRHGEQQHPTIEPHWDGSGRVRTSRSITGHEHGSVLIRGSLRPVSSRWGTVLSR